MEYNIDHTRSKGLFVIVKHVTHHFKYPTADDDWSKKSPLNYQADVDTLVETLGLQGDSFNLPPEKDLTNETFDSFITKEVCEREWEKSPAFIMMFLMSHGFEDGIFLLSEPGSKVKDPCCKGKKEEHSHKGSCYTRRLVDVIGEICRCEQYKGIPKVFIVQCCRGMDSSVIDLTQTSSGTDVTTESQQTTDTELFIPECPDTLVLRASVEGNIATVVKGDKSEAPGGSLLIQHFCQALDELRANGEQFRKLLQRVGELQGEDDLKKSVTCELNARREDIIGGWVMNVCQRTSALVTNYLVTDTVTSVFANVANEHVFDTQWVEQTFFEYIQELQRFGGHRSRVAYILKLCRANDCRLARDIIQMFQNDIVAKHIRGPKCQKWLRNRMTGNLSQYLFEDSVSRDIVDVLLACDVKSMFSAGDGSKLTRDIIDVLNNRKASVMNKERRDEVEKAISICTKNSCQVIEQIRTHYKDAVAKLVGSGKRNIVKDMTRKSELEMAFGKQQPHISSSLSKKMSCYKLLMSQE